MASLNHCSFIGHLGSDPVMMDVNGKKVCNFSVAVNEKSSTHETTTWISVGAWNQVGEICFKNLRKGRMVFIEGALRIKERELNGQKKTNVGIILSNIQFLDRGNYNQ